MCISKKKSVSVFNNVFFSNTDISKCIIIELNSFICK